MAERRMFAKSIIDSDAFLDMSLSTQALYFHLSMRADDDGFINNPKKIQRMIGSNEDDLKVLLAKKFILQFESGVIVIKHWKIHNYIQKDRYKPSNYHDEKALLGIKENNVYTLDTENIQDVHLGKVRLELDKDRERDRGSREEKTPPLINPDLKKMINNQKTSGNKVTEIINYYRDNISDRNENIKEQASYNQITLKSYDIDKMLIGLKNYKRYLDTSKKQPQPLFFFIRDDIYKDYQVENAVVIGKNNAIVPADLIGKTFVVDNEKIRFEDDGYYKVDKDWKVTNGENVKNMVELVRSGM